MIPSGSFLPISIIARRWTMRTVTTGTQDFEYLVSNHCFYVDKTNFIKEWWENMDVVTLITRPRRFGKTLTMSMAEKFFSIEYAGSDLFDGLSIWQEEKYRQLQGSYPVISLSFANIKENTYALTRKKICQMLVNLYAKYSFLKGSSRLEDSDLKYFSRVSVDMDDVDASLAIYQLSSCLYRYYGKKVIILLDEYDTPMQEAYVNGFWNELVQFVRNLFNSAFKTNPWLERAILTGITRVSNDSLFSDLNNPKVAAITSSKYQNAFGFTEEEVFHALDEYKLSDRKAEVKTWYDGFVFGHAKNIYNPWSIVNFLDERECAPYWADTSSNKLVSKLVQESDKEIKMAMENLLQGKNLCTQIDEKIVYDELSDSGDAIWSLLLASGYLRVDEKMGDLYSLALTNYEVQRMFEKMIRQWFRKSGTHYNDFVKALMEDDVDSMNDYMNIMTEHIFSYFDAANSGSEFTQPEKFYHGFVLGLIVDLKGRYVLTSNRESGFGRYDVMLEPLKNEDNAIIIEFKACNPRREKSLGDAADLALKQIEEKHYDAMLLAKGIPSGRIKKYGFAFQGKEAFIKGDGKNRNVLNF